MRKMEVLSICKCKVEALQLSTLFKMTLNNAKHSTKLICLILNSEHLSFQNQQWRQIKMNKTKSMRAKMGVSLY